VVEPGAGDIYWRGTNINLPSEFAHSLYDISPTSPCIDAGTNYFYFPEWDTGYTALDYDLNGVHRPIGSGWDIGAYEFNPDGFPETISKPDNIQISVSPNPFNSSCKISAPDGAKISIFDLTGKRVAEIPLAGREAQKNRQCRWKPDNSIGSGIYLVKAKIGDKEITKRVVYLK
jgi:hypothetical protein